MYCHEKFTVAQTYMRQLLMNTYLHGDYELPVDIPIVPIASSFQARLFPEAGQAPGMPAAPAPHNLQPDTDLRVVAEPVGGSARDALPEPASFKPRGTCLSRSQSPTAERTSVKRSKRKQRKQRDNCTVDDDYEPPRKEPVAATPRDTAARRARSHQPT